MAKILTDIVIIGGGAAGLMAAASAAELGRKVIVVEKMPRPARKVMITGKGRCNFTNMKRWNEFSSHVHPKANLLKPAFYNFPPESVVDFFSAAGVPSVVERGDRVFPESHIASDIVDALQSTAESAGAKIMTGTEVVSFAKQSDGFCVETASGLEIGCKKLVITTGGLSYPSTGSTGDGYVWANELGLKLTATMPSLTALVPEGYKRFSESDKSDKSGSQSGGSYSSQVEWRSQSLTDQSLSSSKQSLQPSNQCVASSKQSLQPSKCHIDRSVPMSEWGSSLEGLQLKNVRATILIDGNEADSDFGDIDFTDGGVEGSLIFRLSRLAVKAMVNGSKVQLSLDLKPAVAVEKLENEIEKLWKSINFDSRSYIYVNGRKRPKPYSDRLKVLLYKLLPKEMVPAFFSSWHNPDYSRLAERLKNWNLKIVGYVGYERCVVTAGGVCAEEFNAKTLEVKSVPGLYFAGEVLDLDADTGGYNLQIAFSTGRLAGQSAAKSLTVG